MTDNPPGEIAYILKGFPRLSETFIKNEVSLLENMGLRLQIFSIKSGDMTADNIKSCTEYLPGVTSVSNTNLIVWLYRNLPYFIGTHFSLARRRPGAYWRTLLMALAMSWNYRERAIGKLKKAFIKEFLQAGYIALGVLNHRNIHHLHGHFCHGATTVTWFVSELTGLPFSFTAHAKDIYQKKLNPNDLLQRKLAAARFVVTCTASNQRYLSALIPQKRIVHKVYHGLDPRFFTPLDQEGDRDKVPLILSVGRFVEKKGFLHLVNACAQLKQSGIPLQCIIVGEKGEHYEPVLKQIKSLGLNETVSLRQPVSQEHLREIYRRATVFTLPCQVLEDGDRDGIPNVLVEAMAMKLPVVSTRISGIPELITDDENGLLVPERNSEALAITLGRLLKDPQLRNRLGNAARQTVQQRFDSRNTTRKLRDLLLGAADQIETAA